ncbi:hypothetical protein AAC387_Pa09g0325 [Persea americana]
MEKTSLKLVFLVLLIMASGMAFSTLTSVQAAGLRAWGDCNKDKECVHPCNGCGFCQDHKCICGYIGCKPPAEKIG